MTDVHVAVAELLMDIERELRVLQLWDDELPPADALASTQPFAVDTLNFPQWLQFIFIERMYFLVDQRSQLPNSCGIAPMAEQYFAVLQLNSTPLISHLQKMDDLLTHV